MASRGCLWATELFSLLYKMIDTSEDAEYWKNNKNTSTGLCWTKFDAQSGLVLGEWRDFVSEMCDYVGIPAVGFPLAFLVPHDSTLLFPNAFVWQTHISV